MLSIPTTDNSRPRACFFDLPPELRNQIYSYVLIRPRPIMMPYAYEKRPGVSEPALLRTHRLVRAEATPIFYGGNVFEAPSPAAAHAFLSALPPCKISHIRAFRPIAMILPTPSAVVAAGDGGEVHRRWFEGLRTTINRLVGQCGKGVLQAEAVSVPMRKSGSACLEWLSVLEVEQFHCVNEADDDARTLHVGSSRAGGGKHSWRLEWNRDWRESAAMEDTPLRPHL